MAKNITRHITHIKSKVVESSNPKLPASGDIELGEIAVNYAKGYETLSIKNESGDVVTFSEDKNIGKKGKLTGYAKASSASAVATGDTINTAIGKLEKALDGKSNNGHTHDDRYYTESELTGSSTTVVVAKASSAATAASASSVAWGNVSGKPSSFTPSSHNQASNTITAMTGYAVAATSGDITTSDTLNAAIGKLEKNDNDIKKQIGSGFTVSSITEVIEENEEIISSALNDLEERKRDSSAYTRVHYSKVNVTSNLTNITCPVTLSTNGEQCNVLYVNNSKEHTVTISTIYKSPDNSQINLTIKANGYAEVNYLYFDGVIYVRGV